MVFGLHALLLLGAGTGCFSTDPPPLSAGQKASFEQAKCTSPDDTEAMADQVFKLVNLHRQRHGLQPVASSVRLNKIATDYACHMIEEGFFAHQDPLTGDGPSSRALSQKYLFFAIGENLAAGPQSAEDVMSRWMQSPSHRKIILDPTWRELGVGVRIGGKYATYWVQEFGDPIDF